MRRLCAYRAKEDLETLVEVKALLLEERAASFLSGESYDGVLRTTE